MEGQERITRSVLCTNLDHHKETPENAPHDRTRNKL